MVRLLRYLFTRQLDTTSSPSLILMLSAALLLSACRPDPDGLYHDSRPSFDASTGTLVASVRKNGRGQIERIMYDGKRQNLTNEGDAFHPNVADDGKHIAFARSVEQRGSEIWLMDSDGRNLRRLVDGNSWNAYPVILDVKETLLFARASRQRSTSMGGTMWVDWEVFEIPLQGGDERKITSAAIRQVNALDVAPDETKAVLSTDDLDSPNQLDEIDLASGQLRQIGLPGDMVASVGRKSGRITFVRDSGDFNYEVFLMNSDGSQRQQLTSLKSYTWAPVLSPDEERVIFMSDPTRRQRFHLWEARVNDRRTSQMPIVFDR